MATTLLLGPPPLPGFSDLPTALYVSYHRIRYTSGVKTNLLSQRSTENGLKVKIEKQSRSQKIRSVDEKGPSKHNAICPSKNNTQKVLPNMSYVFKREQSRWSNFFGIKTTYKRVKNDNKS